MVNHQTPRSTRTSNAQCKCLVNPDTPLVMDTVTGPGTLDQIQHTLDHLWSRQATASDKTRIQVDLAACEIGANIIKYAAGGQPVRIQMHAEVRGPQVRVSFADDGHPALIDLDALRMPTELTESGRGLALAVSVLDELDFRRDGETNRWTLVRRLDG